MQADTLSATNKVADGGLFCDVKPPARSRAAGPMPFGRAIRPTGPKPFALTGSLG